MSKHSSTIYIPTKKVVLNNTRLIGFQICELNKHKDLLELMDESRHYTSKGLTYFNEDDLKPGILNKCIKGLI